MNSEDDPGNVWEIASETLLLGAWAAEVLTAAFPDRDFGAALVVWDRNNAFPEYGDTWVESADDVHLYFWRTMRELMQMAATDLNQSMDEHKQLGKLERALQIAANEYVHDVFETGDDYDTTADIEKVKSEWLEQAGGGDGDT